MNALSTETKKVRENKFAPNPTLKIWLDGELLPPQQACISVFDHALLYGDGIFEGIRIYNGAIFKEKEHLKRFAFSAKALRLELPYSLDEISKAMHETIRANGMSGDGYIRLLGTRGVGALGISVNKAACPSVVVIAATISLYPQEVYARGLNCIISATMRMPNMALSPRIKSLNYLNNVLAKLEAQDAGADEAIMVNHIGYICEATGDNLFMVKEGRVYTPPTCSGILDGITRAVVMEIFENKGMPVKEKNLIPYDIYTADEVFLTGTAAEIVPVASLNKRLIGDGRTWPVTRQLMKDFVEYRNRACR